MWRYSTEAKGHLLFVFPQVTQRGTKVFLSGDDASPPPPPRNDDRIITHSSPLVETCHWLLIHPDILPHDWLGLYINTIYCCRENKKTFWAFRLQIEYRVKMKNSWMMSESLIIQESLRVIVWYLLVIFCLTTSNKAVQIFWKVVKSCSVPRNWGPL